MAFTPIELSSLTLSAHPTHPNEVERATITLSATPPEAWVQRFAATPFSESQFAAGASHAVTHPRPKIEGGRIVADLYIPQAAALVSEIRAAVTAANTWYETVQDPALTAAATAAAARQTARTTLQTALNALLSA